MLLCRLQTSLDDDAIGVVDGASVRLLDRGRGPAVETLSDILHDENPILLVESLLEHDLPPVPLGDIRLLAPVNGQEVWAAGVTYKRSQTARMEESESGASHYDRVYTADRPELFFKSLPERVVHPFEPIRARSDSKWSVPEPELALLVSPDLRIVGYSVGNDVSARDIEGENPLYLPQAKVYDQSCAIGPYVKLADQPLPLEEITIELIVKRDGTEVVHDETRLSEMARSFTDLVAWLGKEYALPQGAVLLTGTGIIPPDDFTLQDGDAVKISIAGIGELINPVIRES
ncbi:fumarylacetoacetate hydrolase family protein [Stratiformator vulcanicus]|uniref:Fumarylacetoacetase-like C-terminal domain-containing protein n=1 Tax=Stratiformator vulcanicus TaxID=2527980 RepID=A0A517R497_9PLAN|nr:fumarylacetoacetate hydrolase family protein [Stratiformator vulcanicus]QDT38670.1 hypothetical protein Pan189_30660 [Stratiformator vulcanicus]